MQRKKMMVLAASHNVSKIALPAIGAGLGGLQWEDVKKILDDISEKRPSIDLYVVESFRKI